MKMNTDTFLTMMSGFYSIMFSGNQRQALCTLDKGITTELRTPPIILHVIDSPETLREMHQLPLSLQQNERLAEQPGEGEAYFDPLAIHCCRTMLCEVCTS